MRSGANSARTADSPRNGMVLVLLAGCATILASHAAGAQSLGARQATPQTASPAAGSTTAPANAGGGGLAEIVVTAQRVRQDVQKTPGTVMVIDGETLRKQGVTDFHALDAYTPMASFAQESDNTEVFIRGIGQQTPDDANDPGTATYIDQVYVPADALSVPLFDVERVEVLAGPQGTLYGRDAVGGAVNVYTNKPAKSFGAEGMLEYGNYNERHASGVINVPLGQSLSLRLAADYEAHNGYLSYGGDDENAVGSRIGLLYDPSGGFSNLLRYEYDHLGGVGDGSVVLPECTNVDVTSCKTPSNPWDDSAVGNFDNRRIYHRVTDELHIRLGDSLGLTSIAGYIDVNSRFTEPVGSPATLTSWANLLTDFGYLYGYPPGTLPPNPFYELGWGIDSAKKQWSEELRLAEETARYHWITGLYWLRFHTDTVNPPFDTPAIATDVELIPGIGCGPNEVGPFTFAPNPGPCFADQSFNTDHVVNNSYAAYADGTYSVLDWLRLEAGLRLSIDEKSTVGTTEFVLTGNSTGTTPFAAERTWRHFDWKVGIEGDIQGLPSSHFYAKVETGYVEGGVNDIPGSLNSTTVTGTTYEPETVLAYTVGIKNRFLENHLQVNDEAFYYDFSDLQLGAFSTTLGGTDFFNIAKSVSYGDQLDIAWAFAHATRFGIDIGLLKAYVENATLPQPLTYEPGGALSDVAIPPQFLDALSLGGTNGMPWSFSSYALPNSPAVSASAHLEHTFLLADGASLDVLVSSKLSSSYWTDYTHEPGLAQPSYTRTDTTVTYTGLAGRWYVAVWGRNLEGAAVKVEPAATSVYGLPAAYLDDPRTYGARIGVRF